MPISSGINKSGQLADNSFSNSNLLPAIIVLKLLSFSYNATSLPMPKDAPITKAVFIEIKISDYPAIPSALSKMSASCFLILILMYLEAGILLPFTTLLIETKTLVSGK